MSTPFELSGVVHLVRPAFLQATNLDELREGIANVEDRSLFHHAVQFQLRSPAGEELPPDDFSAWVAGVVQDRDTAERLSFAVQRAANGPAPLREGLLHVLDGMSQSTRKSHDAPEAGAFVFLVSESVVVPTGRVAHRAADLFAELTAADDSVWFHHFVERPWFDGSLSIAEWLRDQEEPQLAGWLDEAAGQGLPLERMRRQLIARWRRRSIGPRVAAAQDSSEFERREAGREAVARLVQRIRQGEPR
jgi:hypothetical protein